MKQPFHSLLHITVGWCVQAQLADTIPVDMLRIQAYTFIGAQHFGFERTAFMSAEKVHLNKTQEPYA